MKHKPLLWQGKPLTPELLLRLQHQAGNRAVVRLLDALRNQLDEPEPLVKPSPPIRPNVPSHDDQKKMLKCNSSASQVNTDNPENSSRDLHRDNANAGTQTSEQNHLTVVSDSMLSLPPGKRHWLARLFWWLVWLLTFGLVDRRTGTQHHSRQGGR